MSRIIKVTMVMFVVMVIFAAGLQAMAAKPAYTGLKYPAAVDGQKGSVTGRVTYTNGTVMGGAYIAIVNASNFSQEYVNTTSDANGYYQIVGVNASYNHNNSSDVGPSGATPYVIYANKSPYGEGYSAAFGVDAYVDPSSPNTSISAVTVPSTASSTATPTASASATASPSASATASPSASATASPEASATTAPTSTAVPTPTATATPAPAYLASLASLLVAGYFAAGAISKRKNK